MELTLVTYPGKLKYEIKIIKNLFEMGLKHLHIRKPNWSYPELEKFVKGIPMKYRDRVGISKYHQLIRFDLGYMHFDEDNPTTFDKMRWKCKKTITLDKIEHLRSVDPRMDIVFLQPVFEHLEKPSIKTYFKPDAIKAMFQFNELPAKIYAAGGVNLQRLQHANELGFDGAVIMEYFWGTYLEQGLEQALDCFANILEVSRVCDGIPSTL